MHKRKVNRGVPPQLDEVAELRSAHDMAAYFQACLEASPNDPDLVIAALGDLVRERGIGQLAKATGFSREGLYRAFERDRDPRIRTVLKVLRALGLKFMPQVA
jgi:probable addiction module antidote protein